MPLKKYATIRIWWNPPKVTIEGEAVKDPDIEQMFIKAWNEFMIPEKIRLEKHEGKCDTCTKYPLKCSGVPGGQVFGSGYPYKANPCWDGVKQGGERK